MLRYTIFAPALIMATCNADADRVGAEFFRGCTEALSITEEDLKNHDCPMVVLPKEQPYLSACKATADVTRTVS